MTEVTEAQIEAGLAVFKIGPTGWSATDAATVVDIYEEMEAARIPAAPDDVERAELAWAEYNHDPRSANRLPSHNLQTSFIAGYTAALSAIPTPATGEVERADIPRNWELSNGPVDGDLSETIWELSNGPVDGDLSETIWQVHRVNGGRNDREWTLIATGETAWQALEAALTDHTTKDDLTEQGEK